MAKIITKHSTTPASAPSGLTVGELAVNLADRDLYVGGTAGTTYLTGVKTYNGVTGAVQGVSSANGLTGAVTFRAGQGITLSTSGNGISFAVDYQFGGQTFPTYGPGGPTAAGVDIMLLQRKSGTGSPANEMYIHNIANLFAQFVPQYIPIVSRNGEAASTGFGFIMTGVGGDVEVSFASQIELISQSLTAVDGGTYA